MEAVKRILLHTKRLPQFDMVILPLNRDSRLSQKSKLTGIPSSDIHPFAHTAHIVSIPEYWGKRKDICYRCITPNVDKTRIQKPYKLYYMGLCFTMSVYGESELVLPTMKPTE